MRVYFCSEFIRVGLYVYGRNYMSKFLLDVIDFSIGLKLYNFSLAFLLISCTFQYSSKIL